MAQLTPPLVGLGEVEYQGEVITGAELLQKLEWQPIQLASKEGLALLNGTQNMGAFAVWALLQSYRLSEWADRIAAMSLDDFSGESVPFPVDFFQVLPYYGKFAKAERMR